MSLRIMHENNKKNVIKQSEPTQSPNTEELLSLIRTVLKESGAVLDQSEAIVANSDLTEITRITLRRADTKVKSSSKPN